MDYNVRISGHTKRSVLSPGGLIDVGRADADGMNFRFSLGDTIGLSRNALTVIHHGNAIEVKSTQNAATGHVFVSADVSNKKRKITNGGSHSFQPVGKFSVSVEFKDTKWPPVNIGFVAISGSVAQPVECDFPTFAFSVEVQLSELEPWILAVNSIAWASEQIRKDEPLTARKAQEVYAPAVGNGAKATRSWSKAFNEARETLGTDLRASPETVLAHAHRTGSCVSPEIIRKLNNLLEENS